MNLSRRPTRAGIVLNSLLVMAAGSVGAADGTAPAVVLPRVDVIGTTPLPGIGLPREQLPGPVQSATSTDIENSQALDLTDFLNRRMGGIFVNEVQNNPFQPDVNYRGYTASPLLGTPQGLSIYLDGVRLNQPFGDVVSWDLIPRAAIANVTLMPGSNPLFGLNTLGGALSIQTKDGRTHPGASVQAMAGSYGRRSAEFEYGASNESFDWYLTGNLFRESGWREESPSRVGQLFGKVGWRNAATDVKVSIAHANNSLHGNGLQDSRLLDRNYSSVYTKPDITDNRSTLLNLSLTHVLGDSAVLGGNAYYRNIVTGTFNGDINEGSLDQSVYQPSAGERAALAAAGYTGFPAAGANAANTPFPFWRCIANVLLRDEPGEKCNALVNRSHTDQQNYGVSGQITWQGTLGGQRNQFTAGAGYDASKVRFGQTTQLGYLNPDRSVTGLNAFADGVTGGDVDGVPFDNRVELDGRIRTASVYATNTLSIGSHWHLTVSGRHNRTTVRNSDLVNPGGGANSLDGDHAFSRFNPAIGITTTPTRAFAAYLGYNEGSRAPTSIELGCANPLQPCRLPNSMAGDPPLNQVVTKTWEAGAHGTLGNGLRWNAGVFRAENVDDILFVAAPNQTQFGYFKNFGKTRREGLELGLNGRAGVVTFGAHYTWLNATFQSTETVNGTGNSSNDTAAAGARGLDGNITIRPGNRIPLVPQHLFKAYADVQVTPEFTLGLNVIAVGSSYARGNENNAHQPDGTYYLGSGKAAGYGILNLGGQYRFDKRFRLIGQINNLLDRKYETAAQLGPTGFDANGNFIARPFPAVAGEFPVQQATFYSPGAPRTFWIGMRYLFDAPAARP